MAIIECGKATAISAATYRKRLPRVDLTKGHPCVSLTFGISFLFVITVRAVAMNTIDVDNRAPSKMTVATLPTTQMQKPSG